jgi:hypothetical protein
MKADIPMQAGLRPAWWAEPTLRVLLKIGFNLLSCYED